MSSKPRVFVTCAWPDVVMRRLSERYLVGLNKQHRTLTGAELAAIMADYDALCPTVSDRVDLSFLEGSERRVRLIASYGVGTDHIDLDGARRHGIVVTNTPDILTDATAELAVLLMLMVSRRAGEGERELRDGRWQGWRPTHLMGRDLSGVTLGVVGFGRIAQATAKKARALWGVEILYHSRSRLAFEIERECAATYVPTLNAIAEKSDVVSLHCPATAATHHLVDANFLSNMRRDAILINTARGSVVDENALARGLASGEIAAAGLDVYEREPTVTQSLLELSNVVLLPHLGSATMETRTAMGLRVLANLDSFFAGEAPRDRVA